MDFGEAKVEVGRVEASPRLMLVADQPGLLYRRETIERLREEVEADLIAGRMPVIVGFHVLQLIGGRWERLV